jgi:uncharacterized protein
MDAKTVVDGGWERAVLAFALVYPALLTLVYFVWLVGAPEAVQQIAYGVGKGIQFGLPLVWMGCCRREPLRWPRPNASGLMLGVGFALIVLAGMMALYFGWLRSAGVFDAGAKSMQLRLDAIGIHNPAVYAGVGLFYSLIHSLLEEYYWRWFVFRGLRRHLNLWPAIAISSIAFMGHHVIVLGTYFGWESFWTYFFSLATAVGGAYWAWLYERSGSIYGPWASHLLMDAGIFGLGYDLMRSVATG